MGEGTLPRDVADRPDPGRHPHPTVDRDAPGPLVEAQRTHAEPGQVAAAPRGHQHPLAAQGRPVGQVHGCPGVPGRSTRSMVAPVCTSTPSRRSTSVMSSEASGSSGPASRGPASTMVTRDPEAAHDLPDLEADGPAADDEQRGRHRLGGDRFPVGPVRHGGEHRRDDGPLAGGQDQRAPCRARLAADLDRGRTGDPGLARGRGGRPCPRSDRRRPCRPRSRWPPCGRAGPPATSPGVTVDVPAMPGMRRPSASRSAARTIILEGMHPQYGHSPPTSSASMPTTSSPGLRQLLRHLLTARAQPDDDGVDLHGATARPSW